MSRKRINMGKKVLFISAVAGFLSHFEKNNVMILQEMGYEVHFASNKNNMVYHTTEMSCEQIYRKMNVIYHDISIQQSPFAVLQNMKAVEQTRRIIKQENINVIHCSTPNGGVIGRVAALRSKIQAIKVLYYVHGFHFCKDGLKWKDYIFRFVEGILARCTDIILTINHEDYKAAQKFKLRKNGNVYCVPGVGVDLEYYRIPTYEERKKARHQLGVENKFFLLSVGEIRQNKNQITIVKALEAMKNIEGNISDIVYGLVGEEKNGYDLESKVTNMGIRENVIFYGYQTDIRPYLRAADVVVFPSIREGLGMAALEALAMGVFVIAADNRGTREYIIEDLNGVRNSATDTRAFTNSIQTAYKENYQKEINQAKKMEIRKSVHKFSEKESIDILRGIYHEVFS